MVSRRRGRPIEGVLRARFLAFAGIAIEPSRRDCTDQRDCAEVNVCAAQKSSTRYSCTGFVRLMRPSVNRSAIKNASSSDWLRFRRGSQAVS